MPFMAVAGVCAWAAGARRLAASSAGPRMRKDAGRIMAVLLVWLTCGKQSGRAVYSIGHRIGMKNNPPLAAFAACRSSGALFVAEQTADEKNRRDRGRSGGFRDAGTGVPGDQALAASSAFFTWRQRCSRGSV